MLNKYRGFSTKSELEGISNNLQQTEEWLYEEGVDESLDVYTEKLEYLKQVLNNIEFSLIYMIFFLKRMHLTEFGFVIAG
jgi:hypothetical protein